MLLMKLCFYLGPIASFMCYTIISIVLAKRANNYALPKSERIRYNPILRTSFILAILFFILIVGYMMFFNPVPHFLPHPILPTL